MISLPSNSPMSSTAASPFGTLAWGGRYSVEVDRYNGGYEGADFHDESFRDVEASAVISDSDESESESAASLSSLSVL